MTKQITINGQTYLLVAVPEDSTDHLFDYWPDLRMGSVYYDIKGNQYGGDTLEGNYEIIGKGNEIDETTWRTIVERAMVMSIKWIGYEGIGTPKWYDNATESGLSMVRSQGFKPEGCLVLKLVK